MSALDNTLLSDSEELSNEAVKASTTAAERSLYGAGSMVGRQDYTVGDDGNYYNADGERVYYWVRPRETDSTMQGGVEEMSIGSDFGGYYTEAEIRSAWNAKEGMGYFKERTSWDNYWGYLTERQALIQSGDLPDPTNPEYLKDFPSADVGPAPTPNVGSSFGGGRDEEHYYGKLAAADQTAREEAMASFVQANAALMDKYGIESTIRNKDGDTFMFNGSTYVRTDKIEDGFNVGGLIGAMVLSTLTAGALAPVGAGLFGAGALGKGVTAAVSSALTQGAMTGSIDPRSVITSGLMAGLNPGGMVTDSLGMNPDSFGAGVVGGFTDSATRGLLSGDGVDFGQSLLAGLGKGAANSILDFFKDMSQRSIEDRMKMIAEEHARMYPGMEPLTDDQLYEAAIKMQGTGTSDLGGLIGKDGLIPGMDEVSTKWVNNLFGGNRFDMGGLFIGPDGKQYTDLEMREKFPDVDLNAVGQASLYGQAVDGFTYAATTQEKTWLGKLWDAMKENVPGLQKAADFIDNGLDEAARAQFINDYGFDPYEHPDAARQVFVYGAVDETYTFSDNPRGDAEVVGQVYGSNPVDPNKNPNTYQSPGPGGNTGTTFQTTNTSGTAVDHAQIISYYQDAKANGTSPEAIVQYLTDQGVAGQTMPGSDVTYGDAILQGILDGILTGDDNDGGGDATGTDAGTVFDEREKEFGTDYVIPDETGGRQNIDDLGDDLSDLDLDSGTLDNTLVIPDGTPPTTVFPPDVEPPPDLPPELGPPPQEEIIFGSATVMPHDVVLPGASQPMGGSFSPDWGDLFDYTTITEPQKAALAPYKDYVLEARRMLSDVSGIS